MSSTPRNDPQRTSQKMENHPVSYTLEGGPQMSSHKIENQPVSPHHKGSMTTPRKMEKQPAFTSRNDGQQMTPRKMEKQPAKSVSPRYNDPQAQSIEMRPMPRSFKPNRSDPLSKHAALDGASPPRKPFTLSPLEESPLSKLENTHNISSFLAPTTSNSRDSTITNTTYYPRLSMNSDYDEKPLLNQRCSKQSELSDVSEKPSTEMSFTDGAEATALELAPNKASINTSGLSERAASSRASPAGSPSKSAPYTPLSNFTLSPLLAISPTNPNVGTQQNRASHGGESAISGRGTQHVPLSFPRTIEYIDPRTLEFVPDPAPTGSEIWWCCFCEQLNPIYFQLCMVCEQDRCPDCKAVWARKEINWGDPKTAWYGPEGVYHPRNYCH